MQRMILLFAIFTFVLSSANNAISGDKYGIKEKTKKINQLQDLGNGNCDPVVGLISNFQIKKINSTTITWGWTLPENFKVDLYFEEGVYPSPTKLLDTLRAVQTEEYTASGLEPEKQYSLIVILVSECGNRSSWGIIGPAKTLEIPKTFKLHQNYPNPFNPTTTIRYEIKEAGKIRLDVYNVLGQLVETLVNETKDPGFYQVKWSGVNHPNGVYFYRLYSTQRVETRRMILNK